MTVTPAALEAELVARGAIVDGHFKLSSGRHSARFVQKFRILEDPRLVADVARALLAGLPSISGTRPTVVVSAAVGGIVLGYECARQLGTLGIFVEKQDGRPTFRRGFALTPADRVLVVEDVVTTGLSVREIFEVVRATGAAIVAVAVIVRRAQTDFDVPTLALLDLPIASFDAADCPQCAAGLALTEPGSRFLEIRGRAIGGEAPG